MNARDRDSMERLIAAVAEVKAEVVAISFQAQQQGQQHASEQRRTNEELGKMNGSIANHFAADLRWQTDHDNAHEVARERADAEHQVRREQAQERQQRIRNLKDGASSLQAVVAAVVVGVSVGAAVVAFLF